MDVDPKRLTGEHRPKGTLPVRSTAKPMSPPARCTAAWSLRPHQTETAPPALKVGVSQHRSGPTRQLMRGTSDEFMRTSLGQTVRRWSGKASLRDFIWYEVLIGTAVKSW